MEAGIVKIVRNYLMHPDRIGIFMLLGLSVIAIPVLRLAGAGDLAFKLTFGGIIIAGFAAIIWRSELEWQGRLPGYEDDREGDPRPNEAINSKSR